MNILEIIKNSYNSYANYLWHEITNPSIHNYFYWLIGVSVLFFILEVIIPWRKNQSIIRKDFWLDAFYMFFNFFIFSLIVYNAASDVVVNLFNNGIKSVTNGFDLQAINPMKNWPLWAILLTGFIVRDFVQWWVHRLLHKSDRLWEFHKVHHSVQEMGFAAHLRYHWMETVVYRSIEYIPLALLGIGLHDFFIIHIFTLAWGHYNHSNISIDSKISGGILGLLIGFVLVTNVAETNWIYLQNSNIGIKAVALILFAVAGALILAPVMKKLFNSPEMHIWHHAEHLPKDRRTGVNFGLTLAIWDYIFGTDYIPKNGRDIKLGFPKVEEFPKGFIHQEIYGFKKLD